MKQVQIVVPYDRTEAVFNFLLENLKVRNIVRLNIENGHLLQFRISDDATMETIEKLKFLGVGVEYGFIDILDLKASLPREAEEPSKEKITQREAMLAVEEIYENVKSGTSLSFDFLAFVILSAAMAGFGLIQNNVTIIVASMLLSPLMGPMLGVALGYVVRDRGLFLKGTVNELIALTLSFAVGAILGVAMPLLYPYTPSLVGVVENDWAAQVLTEITRRGFFSPLDVGIAIFSGAAIAISITRGDMSSLVGVAISAALMPPAVNVGMMITLGLIAGSPVALGIGVGSFFLVVMNIVVIDIAAIIMFRIKRLAPIADKSAHWRAVTQFTPVKSADLYHTNSEGKAKTETEEVLATFTPAPSSQGPPMKHDQEKSKDDSDQSTNKHK